METENSNISEKLIEVQNELKAPKNLTNNFGKYKYRNAEQILKEAKPISAKYGCGVRLYDEVQLIGNRYYVVSTAIFFSKITSETITSKGYAREAENKTGMDASQITGAATSYARKYALGGLFGIDDGIDADSMGNNIEEEKSAETPKTEFPEKLKNEVDGCENLNALKAVWNRDVNMKTNVAFKKYVIAKQKQLEAASQQ